MAHGVRIIGSGIDVEYWPDSGMISGFVDVNLYSRVTSGEWDSIKSALKILSEAADFPEELVIETVTQEP